MFCSNCGNKLKDDEKFCGNCGTERPIDNSTGIQNIMLNDRVEHNENKSTKSNRVYIDDKNSFVIKNPGDTTKVTFAVPNNDLYNNTKMNTLSEKDEHTANMLALFSLIFGFGADLLIGAIGMILPDLKDLLTNLGIVGGLPLLGLILMIVARVKYPQNKFAKVVMWIYIASAILTVLAVIILFATCIAACRGLS